MQTPRSLLYTAISLQISNTSTKTLAGGLFGAYCSILLVQMNLIPNCLFLFVRVGYHWIFFFYRYTTLVVQYLVVYLYLVRGWRIFNTLMFGIATLLLLLQRYTHQYLHSIEIYLASLRIRGLNLNFIKTIQIWIIVSLSKTQNAKILKCITRSSFRTLCKLKEAIWRVGWWRWWW